MTVLDPNVDRFGWGHPLRMALTALAFLLWMVGAAAYYVAAWAVWPTAAWLYVATVQGWRDVSDKRSASVG